jgi:hypothetical protein
LSPHYNNGIQINFGIGIAEPSQLLDVNGATFRSVEGGDKLHVKVLSSPEVIGRGGLLLTQVANYSPGSGAFKIYTINSPVPLTRSLIIAHVNQESPDMVTNKIMVLNSDGKIEIGPDTNLYRSSPNLLRTDNQLEALDGLITKTKAGNITDADFVTIPSNGTIAIDTFSSCLYIRIADTWKSVTLT